MPTTTRLSFISITAFLTATLWAATAQAGIVYSPPSIVTSQDGSYITDTVNNTLRVIDPGGIITTLASRFGGAGVAIDAAGNLYVSGDDRVYRIGTNGAVTLFAGQA